MTIETNAGAMRSLVIEREMPYSPEKIWRALTQSDLMKKWLMENDFQPAVGHKFQFRSAPVPNWNGIIDCEVRIVEPDRRLSYTWNSMGLESTVEWTLTPSEKGALVRMEQYGFRPDQEAAYRGANYGWQKFIGNLDTVIASLS